MNLTDELKRLAPTTDPKTTLAIVLTALIGAYQQVGPAFHLPPIPSVAITILGLLGLYGYRATASAQRALPPRDEPARP